jgi:hypothetical protein
MFKNIRNAIIGLMGALTLVVAPVALPALVSADDVKSCLATGANLSVGTNGTCDQTDTTTGTAGINGIIKTVINIFSLVVGVVAVIMVIIGGFRYITSGGDSNNVSSAKNTIIYAIIGLVIVALAQFIVQFVLNKVNGS